jgi:hypothetical protein
MESCCRTFDGKDKLTIECAYLNWRDPKKSGAIVLGINLLFLTMAIGHLSLFSLAAYFLLFYVIAGIIIGKTMPQEDEPK